MKFETIGNAKKLTGLSYLGSANISAKLIKNEKVSMQKTFVLYLAPASTSGYNVPFSTIECRLGCLATSGRAKMEVNMEHKIIESARIKKTELFHEHPEFFFNWLVAEIKSMKTKALNEGLGFSVRLNGTSDIDWANFRVNDQNIFEIFPDVQFYDYTKNPNKFNNMPANYHLTFSFTGKNWSVAKTLLKKGHNVAVVFNVGKDKNLPILFNNYPVIDGDLTDFRPSDEKGVIVGLRFKKIANKEIEKEIVNSMFVVQPTDENCSFEIANVA